uniref:Gypsy retrotransposon integrase-like protein 1-like n=1 Tax=Saccoglossus kowalevskii TaxID=10224 RepID=A0ABM0M0D2_SACKO|nr:PREDICTED: gypsy retrotransposon integrase-like protein 1-like [Saccoglossus kowalevskii]
MGGHLGHRKTLDRIMSQFFWPNLHADVKRYCQSCDVCQKTTPRGRVGKVPLGHMPLISIPFQRVGVDLVGPIMSDNPRKYRYILVLVDYATRYPEASPLKNIRAETVAEELVNMYSRVGIPKEILTDQGKQFISDVMREVSRLFVRQMTTSPYHPQTNGLVEKFNGVLKRMLTRMCEERPNDWDRYISPLLFAYREAPQASLGFSPFELLYGRTVRGPMAILRELWTNENVEPETKLTYTCVLDLRNRLEQTCEMALKELHKSSDI